MNVKFNADELTCLLGEDYDRIYYTLKRNLGPDADLFAERLAGHGYLQWRLPGEGWESVGRCDPALRPTVSQKVEQLKEQIGRKFGANRNMAANILTTPDDNFIYFRKDAYGNIAVCMAAWGYRYPERVNTSDLRMATTPKGVTEKVTITILREGQAVGNYPFELNGYQRKTPPNGPFQVGHVEVGQNFSVAVDGVMNEYTVTRGGGDIKIYLASIHREEEPLTEPLNPANDMPDHRSDNLPPSDKAKSDNPSKDSPKKEVSTPEEKPLNTSLQEKEVRQEESPERNEADNQENQSKKEKEDKGRNEHKKDDKKATNLFGLSGLLPLLCILAMIISAYIVGLKLI